MFSIFSKLNYWQVINDTEVCCALAHDGVEATIKDLEDKFNSMLSRSKLEHSFCTYNTQHVQTNNIHFESQSETLIEVMMKDKGISRKEAMKM